jgi:stage II sporulation protein D
MVSPIKHRFLKLKRAIIKTVFLPFVFCSLFSVCYAQPPKFIRVLILPEATSLRLKIIGAYEVIDLLQNKVFYRGEDLKATVTLYKNKLLLGSTGTYSPKVLIKTENPEALVINGQRFRGDLAFIKKEKGEFSVINYIDIEDYIKGILYHEASHYWPMEALKAQALVCRTYALYQRQSSASLDYDVTKDIYSQVYGGRSAERQRTSKAVQQTKGLVLTFQEKIFPTYFHATCAGHTEDASALWDINLLPLKGIACKFCRQSPHFKWHCVLTLAEIKEKLSHAGHKISRISDIVISSRDNSGRVLDLKIVTDKKEKKISAKDFRNIIGPNIIRSTNFTVEVINGDGVFEGLGWGHGVGLCQWGAYFMAKEGYSAEEILRYYYPGAKLSSLD